MGSIPHFGSISKLTSENGSLDHLQKLDLSGNALGELEYLVRTKYHLLYGISLPTGVYVYTFALLFLAFSPNLMLTLHLIEPPTSSFFLHSCHVTVGDLPIGLSELSSLTALDLGDNSFRGPLPLLGLAKLTKMRSFRVRRAMRVDKKCRKRNIYFFLFVCLLLSMLQCI
jgi:hypothetical protein